MQRIKACVYEVVSVPAQVVSCFCINFTIVFLELFPHKITLVADDELVSKFSRMTQ